MPQHAFIVYGKYTHPYLRLIRITDGLVFDIANDRLAPAAGWPDTALVLGPKDTVINGWPVDLPENLPHGLYDVQLYDCDTASADNEMIAGWRLVMPCQLLVDPTQFPLDIFGRIRTTGA